MHDVSPIACSICRKPIAPSSGAIGFPDFIALSGHPLHPFSGSWMHDRCLIEWPRAEQFLAALSVYLNSRAFLAGDSLRTAAN